MFIGLNAAFMNFVNVVTSYLFHGNDLDLKGLFIKHVLLWGH